MKEFSRIVLWDVLVRRNNRIYYSRDAVIFTFMRKGSTGWVYLCTAFSHLVFLKMFHDVFSGWETKKNKDHLSNL